MGATEKMKALPYQPWLGRSILKTSCVIFRFDSRHKPDMIQHWDLWIFVSTFQILCLQLAEWLFQTELQLIAKGGQWMGYKEVDLIQRMEQKHSLNEALFALMNLSIGQFDCALSSLAKSGKVKWAHWSQNYIWIKYSQALQMPWYEESTMMLWSF